MQTDFKVPCEINFSYPISVIISHDMILAVASLAVASFFHAMCRNLKNSSTGNFEIIYCAVQCHGLRKTLRHL